MAELATPVLEGTTPSDADFRRLVDAVEDYAIFMLDPGGLVLTWNRGAERIKGYQPAEIIGRHFSCLYVEEDVRAGTPARELAAAARAGRLEDEGWRVRKGGGRFWASVVITAMRDERGDLRGFAKVTRDLTRRRQAELRLLQETQDAIALRDRFLCVASHELKTPIASLTLLAQGLARAVERCGGAPSAARVMASTAAMLRQVDALTALIDQLLDVSCVSAGRLELLLEDVDLAEVAREVVTRFDEGAACAVPPVTLTALPGVTGRWDRLRLDQVITNLLSNALKYGLDHPVDLAVEARGDRARLSVTDRGIGIRPEDRARIFERFERGVSERKVSGFGLGLWIARAIVLALGGTIDVESEPDRGTTFLVELPRRAPAARQEPGGPQYS